MDKPKENSESKIIEVHKDLLDILEDLRGKLNEFTYGALNDNVGYKALTCLLAKKIKRRGGIV